MLARYILWKEGSSMRIKQFMKLQKMLVRAKETAVCTGSGVKVVHLAMLIARINKVVYL